MFVYTLLLYLSAVILQVYQYCHYIMILCNITKMSTYYEFPVQLC